MELRAALFKQTLIQGSILFIQAQKIMSTLYWLNEHVFKNSDFNATLCGGDKLASIPHEHRFEYWGFIPGSYILLALVGFIAVFIKNICFMSVFAVLDVTYSIILYWNDLIDTIFVPILAMISEPLICLYITVLLEFQRNPIVLYGPVKTIPSPGRTGQSTYTSSF